MSTEATDKDLGIIDYAQIVSTIVTIGIGVYKSSGTDNPIKVFTFMIITIIVIFTLLQSFKKGVPRFWKILSRMFISVILLLVLYSMIALLIGYPSEKHRSYVKSMLEIKPRILDAEIMDFSNGQLFSQEPYPDNPRFSRALLTGRENQLHYLSPPENVERTCWKQFLTKPKGATTCEISIPETAIIRDNYIGNGVIFQIIYIPDSLQEFTALEFEAINETDTNVQVYHYVGKEAQDVLPRKTFSIDISEIEDDKDFQLAFCFYNRWGSNRLEMLLNSILVEYIQD